MTDSYTSTIARGIRQQWPASMISQPYLLSGASPLTSHFAGLKVRSLNIIQNIHSFKYNIFRYWNLMYKILKEIQTDFKTVLTT